MKQVKSSKLILLAAFISAILMVSCIDNKSNEEVLSFAFMTDIHLNKGADKNACFEGFNKAVLSARENGAEFIITGGDNVDIDGFKNDTASAREMFGRFRDVIAESPLKINATIGNHDRFWGIVTEEHPHGEALFEEYVGPTYYSFENKGWKFMILNTVQVVKGTYMVDSLQAEWIKDELENTDRNTPIILSMHVPMMSVYSASGPGRFGPDMFHNFAQIKDMFNEYNLKLVLQGHQHLYEEIKTRGVQYITAGAVSGSWWGGTYYGTEEGYLLVKLYEDDFSWEYVDYDWAPPGEDK